MTAATKAQAAYFSGFCSPRNPFTSHARCPGGYDGQTCSCDCHAPVAPDVEGGQPPTLTRGVHQLPEVDYFAHPALSCSGAKRLLPPSCPALFRYEREHGRPNKAAFDFGHATHTAVLGIGAPIGVVAADDWRTKAAKERAEALRTEGFTPLLKREAEQVYGMAEALRGHAIASALLDPQRGKPEQSLFWHDERFGVDRRARVDWLPDPRPDGRIIVPDYKTAVSAEPGAFAKQAANLRYDMQHAWYIDAVTAVGLSDQVAFVFIVQEKTAPYLVTVVELDALAVRRGQHLNDRALEVYAECSATDTWPGYSDDVAHVSLPAWATYDMEL